MGATPKVAAELVDAIREALKTANKPVGSKLVSPLVGTLLAPLHKLPDKHKLRHSQATAADMLFALDKRDFEIAATDTDLKRTAEQRNRLFGVTTPEVRAEVQTSAADATDECNEPGDDEEDEVKSQGPRAGGIAQGEGTPVTGREVILRRQLASDGSTGYLVHDTASDALVWMPTDAVAQESIATFDARRRDRDFRARARAKEKMRSAGSNV